VSAEIYKACIAPLSQMKADTEAGVTTEPENNMAKALFDLASQMFKHGVVPRNMEVSQVIALFKKGDRAEPGNYRGISLIEIVLKVVTDIVISRVYKHLEEADPPALVVEQGGFRQRREAVAQFVALYESCKRRSLVGKRTYVLWTDFRKAYDTAGHVALLSKLKEQGVEESLLQFLDGLYRNPKIAAKLGREFSAYQLYLRGCRQGCPASPTLFINFINDLFDVARRLGYGVSVPGWKQPGDLTTEDLENGTLDLFLGLLFADDACFTARGIKQMRRAAHHAEQWANLWRMSFGVGKCGLMVISDAKTARLEANMAKDGEPWSTAMEQLLDADIRLHGQSVPVVTSYPYLGLPFDFRLDIRKCVSARAEVGAKTLVAMRKFVGSNCMPMALRATAVRSFLIPVLAYGSEFFGLQADSLLQPLQRVLKTAMTMVVKGSWIAKIKGRTPMLTHHATMSLELGVPSIFQVAATAKSRALFKWRIGSAGQTRITSVMQQHLCFPHFASTRSLHPHQSTWEGNGCKSLNNLLGDVRKWKDRLNFILEDVQALARHVHMIAPGRRGILTGFQPTLLSGDEVSAKARSMARAIGRVKGILSRHKGEKHAKDFEKGIGVQRQLSNTVGFLAKGGVVAAKFVRRLGLMYPKLAYGLHWVHRIRVNAFYTYRDTVRLNCEVELPAGYECPCCCKAQTEDSLVHYLFECRGPNSEFSTIRGELGFTKGHIQNLLLGVAPVDPPSDEPLHPFKPLPTGPAARAKLSSARLTNLLLIQQTGVLKDRFDIALKQKVGEFSVAQKKLLREMIGPTCTGRFKTKYPLQEAMICLFARFLERAQRGRNKSLWANFDPGIQANATSNPG
jgi:hypothetical protein